MISAYLYNSLSSVDERWVAFMGTKQALSTREAWETLEGQALSKQKEHMCLLKLPIDIEDNQILYYHLILIHSKSIFSEK